MRRDKPFARSRAKAKHTLVIFEVYSQGWCMVTSANHQLPVLRKAAQKCRGMCEWGA